MVVVDGADGRIKAHGFILEQFAATVECELEDWECGQVGQLSAVHTALHLVWQATPAHVDGQYSKGAMLLGGARLVTQCGVVAGNVGRQPRPFGQTREQHHNLALDVDSLVVVELFFCNTISAEDHLRVYIAATCHSGAAELVAQREDPLVLRTGDVDVELAVFHLVALDVEPLFGYFGTIATQHALNIFHGLVVAHRAGKAPLVGVGREFNDVFHDGIFLHHGHRHGVAFLGRGLGDDGGEDDGECAKAGHLAPQSLFSHSYYIIIVNYNIDSKYIMHSQYDANQIQRYAKKMNGER